MTEKQIYFNHSQIQWLEESTKAVFNLLLSYFKTQPDIDNAHLKAASLVCTFLYRPGWIGNKLESEKQNDIYDTLVSLAKPLCFSRDEKTLYQFAKETALLIVSSISTQKPEKTADPRKKSQKDLDTLSELIKAELLTTNSPKEAVSKAALKFYRQNWYHRKDLFKPALPENHPLRALFNLSPTEPIYLPKNDVRSHILKRKTKQSQGLIALLSKAAIFSPNLLIPVLGNDIYTKFKPIGYADKQEKIVLVEVNSSATAHEFNFHKIEFIKTLKLAKGFESICDARIKIFQPSKS